MTSKEHQLACWGLLASAFVLTAVLLTQLQTKAILPTADAAMVVTSGPITAMTARTRQDEEALFVLHNTAQRLLVYRTDLGRKQMRLMQNLDLARAFQTNSSSSTGGGGAAPRMSR